MKRTKTDIFYLILTLELLLICILLAVFSYLLRDMKPISNSFYIAYYSGFSIVFAVLLYKLWKKTGRNWIDKILHKYTKGENNGCE